MALVLDDRVKETSSTTGTGTYTLAGASAGFQAFSAIGNGNTTWYCATDGTDWELGIGTYTAAGTTLARTTVVSSSNADAAVNWAAGTREIFCTIPSAKAFIGPTSWSDNHVLAANGTDGRTVQERDMTISDVGEQVLWGSSAETQIWRGGNDASGPTYRFWKNRSAGNPFDATAIVQDNDVVGSVAFGGADGTDGFIQCAEITGRIDGTPGDNDMPGRLQFYTTADGASSVTERLRITSAGGWGLSGATYGTATDYMASNANAPPTWNPAPIRGHIWGLTMSNAADTANDITIAAGAATDEGHAYVMVLAASITKQLDAAWAVGNAAGGLNTGAEANSTWYEVHLIRRPDTGVVDVMFTTTANRATLPANYTQQRRIGWIRNDGSGNILQFTQVEDHFTWTTQVNDIAAAITATAAAATVTVPPSTIGRFRGGLNVTAVNTGLEVSVVFSEIVEGNVTPTATTGIATLSGSGTNATAGTNDDFDSGHFELRVSSTSTIEYDCVIGTGGTGNFDASTFGYIDKRRRLQAL